MKPDQKDHFQKALFAARVEREKLRKEARDLDKYREALEFYLDHVEQSIHGLIVLCGEADESIPADRFEFEGLPLADACRKVLESTDRFMSPVRVRNALRLAGYSLKEHKNPLAAIHGILKRFEESGEAESLKIAGKTGYRLKPSKPTECAPKHDKKVRKSRLKGKAEMPLLTEGSLKVN